MELFIIVCVVVFMMSAIVLCTINIAEGNDEPLAITCFASLMLLITLMGIHNNTREYKQERYNDCKEIIAEYNKSIPVDCSAI